MASTRLEKLASVLKAKIPQGRINYVVPDIWNAWDYDGLEMRRLPSNELLVNPYRFYSRVIEKYIIPHKDDTKEYLRPLSQITGRKLDNDEIGGDWLKKSCLYSTMIRTSSAWDHDRSFSLDLANLDGMKETGTFVKMLPLLPFLKKMGVDTIYLLPLSRFSLKDKKGELGSPYGVASFFDLDPNLKDNLTGDDLSLEDEFQAFVEACHILSLRVTIDIIPRTNAIVSDLIKTHPDWFYWIKADDIANYKVPYVEGLPETLPPDPKYMAQVYSAKDVVRHIKMFQTNPKDADSSKWAALVNDDPDDFIGAIEQVFGLKVAPAFSDHINDIQPPWTDVTFFRMFLDHPRDNLKYLRNKNVPPYILFDTIKANLFPGDRPNHELWETLAGIIPYYQTNFAIDGARIDMGHALPKELLDMIFTKAKAIDPDFGFIAEELNPDNAPKAKQLGYNIIIGNGFWMQPRIWEKNLHKFVYQANDVALPMFACSETHDSARIAGREGGIVLSRMTTVLNMLLPNLVPFINSAQEVYETQPMNTGVDCTDKDRFKLPETDLFYGKLALFDKYAFHYLHERRWELADHLDGVKEIRRRWVDKMLDRKAFVPIYFNEFDTPAIGIAYFDRLTHKCLIVACNANVHQDISVNASLEQLRAIAGNYNKTGALLYSTYEFGREFTDFDDEGRIFLHLGKGEVKVIEL